MAEQLRVRQHPWGRRRGGRLRTESADDAANDLRRDLLRQCEAAEYAMRAHHVMSFYIIG